MDGPNLYAYLKHHPTNGVDLYGLEEEPYYPLQGVDYHDHSNGMEGGVDHQSNQDVPIGFIEKKKTKKDSMFFCGESQVAEIGISWMNGIMNTLEESFATAKAFSQMANDHFVTFVHNRSRGFIGSDLGRCFAELFFYKKTTSVVNLQARWNAFFDNVGPFAYLLHICHSEAAIITRNALLDYPEELRQRMIIIAIAPGAYIDSQNVYRVVHLRSTRDIVPLFDVVGAYRNRDTTIVLKPHPDASWLDHSVNSPTYHQRIKYLIDSYTQRFGEGICG